MSDADERAASAEELVDSYVTHIRKPTHNDTTVERLADMLQKGHSDRIIAEVCAAAILRLR